MTEPAHGNGDLDGGGGRPIGRRAFVRAGVAGAALVGGGALAVAALRSRDRPRTDGSPVRPRPTDVRVEEFRLRAQPVEWEVEPGVPAPAWGYDGSVPGPEIRVREGDTVRVVLENALPDPTTIHWHGLPVPHAMDGVPDLTQEAVAPGGTFVYEFPAAPSGTYWYHSHVRYQLDRGLVGPLIIEPSSESLAYDQEAVLLFDDWLLAPDDPQPDPTAGGGMMGGGMMGRGRGSMARDDADRDVRPQPLYDRFTVNGVRGTDHPPIEVREGDRLRLRLINASASHVVPLRLPGHVLTITHCDGQPVEPLDTDVLRIGMGERYDVLVDMTRPGLWPLESLDRGQRESGLRIPIRYRGTSRSTFSVAPGGSARMSSYGELAGAAVAADLPEPDRAFDLQLSGGMMRGPTIWTINGERYPDTEPLEVEAGERIRLRIFNMSMMSHPMHLHGHFFDVVAPNNRPASRPIRKDTLMVGHMQTHVVDFTADNPGARWFFHCHNLYHQHGGMATEVRYRT